MDVTMRDVLTHVLEDLLELEFKKFKSKLHEIQLADTNRHIPCGSLEKADALDTANLLLDHYGDEQAAKTTTSVLHLINKRDLASDLQAKVQALQRPGGIPKSQGSTDCQVLYKAAIRQRFAKVKDYNSLPGEWVDLEQRYIQPLIIRKHRNATEREQALLSRGQTHLEMLNKFQDGGTARAGMETFLAADQTGRAPLTLILQGAAGIGKSYILSKMMLDWASDRFYPGRFNYVFHLDLKELGFEKRLVGLEDLILANVRGIQQSLEQILSRPETLLFLMDGFDELRSLPGQAEEISPVAIQSCYQANVMVTMLLRWQLLPGCTLLITTRPTALEKLDSYVCADRYLEVLGFLEPERRAFFYNYFQDDRLALEAYTAIRENELISTMCFVPMVCWIVCTVLKQQMETGHSLASIRTTTHIFLHFTQILLRHHHGRRPEGRAERTPNRDLLEKLGALALHGILRQQVIFSSEDLAAHKLEASEIPTAFLNALLRQSVTVETVYSFGHVTLQEFFAAVFYFLTSQKVQWEQEVNHLLEEGLKAENGHLLLTIRFLFGLSNHQSGRMLAQLVRESSSSSPPMLSVSNSRLLSWIQAAAHSERMNEPQFHLELLHCLYEAHQEDFVKQAMADLDNIRFIVFPLKRSDCLVLAHCMQCCDTVQNLHLFCCGLGAEEVKQLQPVLKKCLLLQLEASNLSDAELRDTCSSFSDRQNMAGADITSIITPDGRKETLFKLKAVHEPAECSLEIRYVLQDDTVAFCSWIIPQHNPSKIILRSNKLSDYGLQKICTALCSAKNRLQTLSLEDNLLSKACVPAISSLVTTVQTMTSLKLGFSQLGDEGAILLWPALSNPRCNLIDLGMDASQLTDACIESLPQSLLQSRTLERLLLSSNSLTAQSLPHLDLVWRECNALHVINLLFNYISSTDQKRYSMFYNAKAKQSQQEKRNS